MCVQRPLMEERRSVESEKEVEETAKREEALCLCGLDVESERNAS